MGAWGSGAGLVSISLDFKLDMIQKTGIYLQDKLENVYNIVLEMEVLAR